MSDYVYPIDLNGPTCTEWLAHMFTQSTWWTDEEDRRTFVETFVCSRCLIQVNVKGAVVVPAPEHRQASDE